MKQVVVKGIIPPVVTPMREDESINEQELRRQVRRQIEGGVHGIFTCGTNGEGYILSPEEKARVLEVVAEEVNGKVPVYAGTGCISTKDTIEQSLRAREIGADVLSVITPSFAAASQNELYEHYRAVAKAVDMPIVLYNIPARTGNALAPATVARLSQIDNIVGVKDSSGSFDNMLQYIEETRQREDFAVLSGNDSLILWNLMTGLLPEIWREQNMRRKASVHSANVSVTEIQTPLSRQRLHCLDIRWENAVLRLIRCPGMESLH